MSGMLINLIIQIIAGAVGGNVAGGAAKNIDLGTIGNTIAGAIGGGAGGQLLGMLIPLLANSASTPDIGSIIGQAAGGGGCGCCAHRDRRRDQEPHGLIDRFSWIGTIKHTPQPGRANDVISPRYVALSGSG